MALGFVVLLAAGAYTSASPNKDLRHAGPRPDTDHWRFRFCTLRGVTSAPVITAGRPVARVTKRTTREWANLFGPAVSEWRRRGVAAFPMTTLSILAVFALAALNTGPVGHHIIRSWVDEYAYLPARSAAIRMIPSFAAPTAFLPCWGAVLQVAVVFGVAEAIYGTRVTAIVALSAHAVATTSARLFVWLGPHVLFGMAGIATRFADAGPSGATVGVIAFVAVRARGRQSLVLLLVYCVGEWFVKHGLAQREHLVAALFGIALGLVFNACASHQTLRRAEPVY